MVTWLALFAACQDEDLAPASADTEGEAPPAGVGEVDPPETLANGGWAELPRLLQPLQEHSVVALRGEVVVIGGYDDARRIVDRVEAYNPQSQQWRSLAPLPEPSHHVNAVALNDRIYVLGVLQESFLESSVTWVYDPDEDQWTEAEAPPFNLTTGSAVVGAVGTDIHLIGGLQSVRAVALHVAYDTVNDDWRELPDSPRRRDHAAGTAVDGVVYAVAGRAGTLSSVIDAVDRFDSGTRTWSEGAPIPTARAGVGHAWDGEGFLHVVGGEGSSVDPNGVFPQHEIYDVAGDVWSSLPPMRTPRHGMGAVVIDGALYVPGGAAVQAFGAMDTFEVWTPEDT